MAIIAWPRRIRTRSSPQRRRSPEFLLVFGLTASACGPGNLSDASDNATGDGAEADDDADGGQGSTCARDEHVDGGMCVPCAPGTERPTGDDRNGPETTCAPTICDANERVEDHACVSCPADLTNVPGDDASGPDTTCDDACAAIFGIQCEQHFEAYVKAQTPSFNFGSSVAIGNDTAAIRHSRGVDLLRNTGTTWTYDTTLSPPIEPTAGSFGTSPAIDGDTLAVGHGTTSGHVHIYERIGSGTWAHTATIQGENTEFGDRFGGSLALEGSLLVVGAGGEDSAALGVDGDAFDNSATDSGAAYIFRRTDGTWAQEAYLKASNTAANAGFGTGISLSGDTIVIGAPGESSGVGGINPLPGPELDRSGAAYVFRHHNGEWIQEAHIKADTPRELGFFGARNDLREDTLVIGDPTANNFKGRIYFFDRSDDEWIQSQSLDFDAPPPSQQQAGYSVKIHNDTVFSSAPFFNVQNPGLLGNPYEAVFPVAEAGGVFILHRTLAGWAQSAVVAAPFPHSGDRFSVPIAVDEHHLIVGAQLEQSAALGIGGDPTDTTAPESGAAYIYRIAP